MSSTLKNMSFRLVNGPIVKPALTRQLGLHKWTLAESFVREKYSTLPGRYIISRSPGCTFCIDVTETRDIVHRIFDGVPAEYTVDLTEL